MKIEKISDNQIRCTLTKEDLDSHQIRISELAYGTDKAKKLFREMMQQAQIEFGFEADNIPLMIEAIPVSGESVILIITKVEDPEELDTRFSKFSPYKKNKQDTIHFDGADNIIDIFQKLYEETKKVVSSKETPKEISSEETTSEETASESQTPADQDTKKTTSSKSKISVNLLRLYSFQQLDDVIAAAHGLDGFYKGVNTLYKDEDSLYQLVVHQSSCTAEEFNKVCNILSEYGSSRAFTPAGEAYLKEHGELISRKALQQLARL
nr:adaptor protein MecA [uncultured Blautia sp.]